MNSRDQLTIRQDVLNKLDAQLQHLNVRQREYTWYDHHYSNLTKPIVEAMAMIATQEADVVPETCDEPEEAVPEESKP